MHYDTPPYLYNLISLLHVIMPIIEIDSLSHPGTEVFSTLTEAQLRNNIEPEKGIFIAEADYVVRIPMSHAVDSLNVAAAAAVAFWELRAR